MPSDPLRVAHHVIRFPVLTETFIINQIMGLIDRGHRVDVYARERGSPDELPQGAERYDLARRAIYGPPVRNAFLRRAFAVPLVERSFGPLSRLAPQVSGKVADREVPTASNESPLPAQTPRRSRSRWWGTEYSVIHAQFGTVALKSLLARQLGLLGGRLVTSFRGYDATWWPTGVREGIYERLFREGDLFLPVSRNLRDRLIELGCDPKRIRVHASGIDTRVMAYRSPSWEPGHPLRLVCVGRLVEKKGYADAIRAVARLIETGHNLRLDIAGDGPERDRLVAQVAAAGLGDRIGFLGRRPHAEVREILAKSHICLVPSVTAANGDQEGIPNVAKEAMAIGLPVVATRHGGIPELVDTGVTGLLVAERDSEGLAEKVEQLMQTPQSWPDLTRRARRMVEERYDSDTLNDELVELYREVVGS